MTGSIRGSEALGCNLTPQDVRVAPSAAVNGDGVRRLSNPWRPDR